MKILITGQMGYVGPAVIRHLRATFPTSSLHGIDTGLFAHCLTGATIFPDTLLDTHTFKDVRDLKIDDVRGFDAVVQLAAVSNDPMGNRFAAVTDEINRGSSVHLARLADAVGVANFVYASSCSIYGIADDQPRAEQDALNPMTAYARSKVETEAALSALDTDMVITSLRFSTACGMSDRLRLDLVLNDFVASALVRGEISILSDGTPWRPLIDIRDMARAIEWGLTRRATNGGRYLAVNVGSNDRNYQVNDLADAVQKALPTTRIQRNSSAPVDSRSYRVAFDLFRELAPQHQPRVTLNDSIAMLIAGLERMRLLDPEFRSGQLMRLRVLERHIDVGALSADLRWNSARSREL